MTELDQLIIKLKKGESVVWQFVDCKKQLLSIFGGEKNFGWRISDFTYIKLIDPDQKLCI